MEQQNMTASKPIRVTQPFLPPLNDYNHYVQGIWERNFLTNQGPLLNEFETRISQNLQVEYLNFVSSGTIALQIAINALQLTGEIITTPFSFIATTSALLWENCTPVFADIDPDSWNVSVHSIEKAITSQTTAILVTHVFGNPCDIEGIDELARKHNLKVIYDASHCFGVKYKEQSILNYGDISTISFHATKLFHTVEGGGLVTKDEHLRERCKRLLNFGFAGPNTHSYVGINGKNSEFHAAMGLCNMNHIDAILKKRKEDYLLYKSLLKSDQLQFQRISDYCDFNYAYVPILLKTEKLCADVIEALVEENIHPRKYFNPSLNTLSFIEKQQPCPISEDISNRILCLPQYHELDNETIQKVCQIINSIL